MAALAIVNDTTEIVNGSLASWKIKSGSASADGVVTVSDLYDASIKIESIGRDDSRKRQRAHAYGIELSTKFIGSSGANCLQKMYLMNQYVNYHYLTLDNGQTLGGQLGTRWRFVAEGGYEASRYVEIMADGVICQSATTDTDYVDFFDPSIPSAASVADPLYGFAPSSQSETAGIYSLSIASGAATAAALTHFRNFSMVVDPLAVKDHRGRSIQYGCDVKIGWDWMQTDEADDMELLDTVLGNDDIDLTIVFPDVTTFTFADDFGLKFSYNAGKDYDDIAFLRCECRGVLTPAEFYATISVA